MSYCEVFNWPYFVVPPDAPQVELYFERTGGRMDAPGWQYTAPDGSSRCSIAVYFGTLALHPGNATEREQHLRTMLELPPESTVRLDYACTADQTLLLRAGEPGHTPWPFSALTADALSEAEALITFFLAHDFRAVLLNRRVQAPDESLLFADETDFYEGYLGEEGLPLKAVACDESGNLRLIEDNLCALIS